MAATEVVAIANFTGEVGELSFKKGDTIKVLEEVDENWSKGKIGTTVGIFPVNFVTTKRIKPSLPANISGSPRSSKVTSSPHRSRAGNSPRHSRSATIAARPSGRDYKPRRAPSRPTSNTSYGSGSHSNSPSLNGVNSRKVQPCARALFTFSGEKKDELSFSEGVKIRLLKRVDNNWLEGELNGKIGIFPQNFVKIEVGLPSRNGESVLADSGKPYARAICDFHGDSQDDLYFESGDLIELLSWAGEGWMKGCTSNNMIGVFPVSFVHVIKPLPVADNSRSPPSVLVSSPSPTELGNAPQPKPRKVSTSNVPKPMPRTRVSPGVPKRSAPCPPGLRSPKQPCERSRPKTPDFEAPTKRTRHRPVTMARSIYNGEHHVNMSTVDPVRPIPRKRMHSVAMSTPVNNQAQLSMQIEQLQSKLTLEQKMLRSAEALLKVATTPDKQAKLDNSITEHHTKVALFEQQLETLMAEHEEHSHSSRSSTTMPRPPSPPREDPAVVKEMMRQKRLDELMETERIYLNDMLICYHDIMPAMSQISGLDINVLFGNISEVVKVTEELLEELEANKMAVGKTFSKFSSRLCTIYGIYCRNNETAMTFLEKYLENPELNSKIQKCYKKAMSESDAHSWDLSSLIIKPVQRITKYPLLISELLKVTDDTHPDWTQLQKAHHAMINANSRINEFKRRKDLVEKYTGAEASIGSRISLHSVRKKMTRVKQSITQRTGLRHKTVDAKFDEEEGRYMESEALVKSVYRMSLAWGDQLQETWRAHVNLAQGVQEAWADEEHQSKSLVDSYHGIVNNAMQDKMKSHLAYVQDHVIHPLQQLLTLFQGPTTLIAKRKDKLLDYDHTQHALEKTKDKDPDRLKQLTEQCTVAKRNYEALNTQLLEELPTFRVKVAKMVSRNVAVFLRAQNQLYLEWAGLLQSLVASDEGVGLVEMHNSLLQEACQQLTQLSVVPSWLGSHMIKSPIATTHRHTLQLSPTPYSAVTLPARGNVKCDDDVTDSNHATEKVPKVGHLYVAVYSFDAEDSAELTVARGDTVVLVTPHDQLGSSEWWLVAKDNTEGYVPSDYLELANEDEGSHELSQERSPEPQLRSFEPQVRSPEPQVRSPESQERSPEPPKRSPDQQVRSPDSQERSEPQDISTAHIYEVVGEPQDETPDGSCDKEGGGATCQVLFSFEAGSDAELSVEEGELLWLLKSHDLTGNSEWWLVQKEGGAKGFVPASYLETN